MKTPEEAAKAEAQRLAEFYFPRSRHQQRSLSGDLFSLIKRFTEGAFAEGLKVGLGQSNSELCLELSNGEVAVIEEAKHKEEAEARRAVDSCACCRVVLEPTTPLCETCASSYETYSDGTAYCSAHEPAEESPVLAASPLPAGRAEEPKRLEPHRRVEPVKRLSDPRGHVPR